MFIVTHNVKLALWNDRALKYASNMQCYQIYLWSRTPRTLSRPFWLCTPVACQQVNLMWNLKETRITCMNQEPPRSSRMVQVAWFNFRIVCYGPQELCQTAELAIMHKLFRSSELNLTYGDVVVSVDPKRRPPLRMAPESRRITLLDLTHRSDRFQR